MSAMHYEVRRALKTGHQLTTRQRTSGTFAEEPIVLGKVMRRGTRPLLLTTAQFDQNKAKLLRLLLSGSIEIFVINGEAASRLDYKTAVGLSKPATPEPDSSAGDLPPLLQAAAEKVEELEAKKPPSSEVVETTAVATPVPQEETESEAG